MVNAAYAACSIPCWKDGAIARFTFEKIDTTLFFVPFSTVTAFVADHRRPRSNHLSRNIHPHEVSSVVEPPKLKAATDGLLSALRRDHFHPRSRIGLGSAHSAAFAIILSGSPMAR